MPVNAEDKAYDRIKSAICKRQIRQGSRLAEATLASRLKLSRTPVRSALRRLSYEGLVEFVPNRGLRLSGPPKRRSGRHLRSAPSWKKWRRPWPPRA